VARDAKQDKRKYFGLADCRVVTRKKASTAALGPFRQRLSSCCNALRAIRLAARNGGKGIDTELEFGGREKDWWSEEI